MTTEIVVLPTHAHAAFVRAEAAEADPRGLSMGLGVMTFGELVDLVVTAALPDTRVLGPLEERLVLRRVAASDVALRGRFAKVARATGFVGALGSTVAACRQANVTAAQLAALDTQLPQAVATRVAAVAALLGDVDREHARLGAVDREEALTRAAEALRAGARLPTSLPEGSRVVLRHVHELSPSRLGFLDALAGRLGPRGELVVELPHDAGDADDPWFRATARVLGRAEAEGAASTLTILPTPPSLAARGIGARVARALSGPGSADAEDAAGGAVEVICAPTPPAEHVLVARRVRDLVDEGVAPERIAVAARDVDAHAGPLADALREVGVPVHERRGASADDTPPLRFLFDVITAAVEGLHKDVVLRLLSSAYAARWAESRQTAGELRRVLARVGVRGRNAGGKRHGALGAGLVDALDRLAGDADAPRTLPLVRRAVADFAERAAPLGQPGTIVEHVARVRRFVDFSGLADVVGRPTSGVSELIAHGGDDPALEAEARAFGRDQAAIDALEVALDELEEAAARVGFEGALDAELFAALLHDALAAHDVASGGLRGGAVRVVGLRDLAGLPVEAAFLVGLRDGELPAPAVDDPLLSTSDRHAVARALSLRPEGPRHSFDVAEDTRMGAVAFATGREAEPLLFYLAAISPSTHLVLSRATTDADGRPVIASPILDDALAALARGEVDQQVFAPPIEPAPALGRAASFDEARRAWVRAIAEVGPTTSAEAAARVDPRGALPDDDPLGVRDLLDRVVIERGRVATMSVGERTEPGGPHGGQLAEDQRARPDRMSASALEDLARCPFLYFAKRVLGVDADQIGGDDPDARQKGTVAHACFQAAVEALIGGGFVPYVPSRREDALAVARRAAEMVAAPRFAALPIDAHLSSVVRDDTVDRVVAVVAALFDAGDGFVPVAVERAFGPPSPRDGPDGEARWPAIDAAGVALHGRIDLVERRGDAIRVTDLKSGDRASLEKKLQPAELGWAELQLPIYAAAARGALGAGAVDGRYLSLRDGEATVSITEKRGKGRNWKNDPRTDADIFALATADGRETALGGRLRDLIDRAAFGDFPVRPRKGACQHCDFAGICRLPRGAPDVEDDA